MFLMISFSTEDCILAVIRTDIPHWPTTLNSIIHVFCRWADNWNLCLPFLKKFRRQFFFFQHDNLVSVHYWHIYILIMKGVFYLGQGKSWPGEYELYYKNQTNQRWVFLLRVTGCVLHSVSNVDPLCKICDVIPQCYNSSDFQGIWCLLNYYYYVPIL